MSNADFAHSAVSYGSSADGPPTSDVFQAFKPFDGVLNDTRWADSTLTFSFPTSATNYAGYPSNEPTTGFQALNVTQMSASRSLLSQVQNFTNLNFTEITETDSTHATMRFAETTAVSTALGYFPSSFGEQGGDTWYRTGNYEDPVLGSYAYNEGFMHEIGHALGLRHGHDSNNPYGKLAAMYDSNEFSVMTYNDYIGDTPGDGSEMSNGATPKAT